MRGEKVKEFLVRDPAIAEPVGEGVEFITGKVSVCLWAQMPYVAVFDSARAFKLAYPQLRTVWLNDVGPRRYLKLVEHAAFQLDALRHQLSKHVPFKNKQQDKAVHAALDASLVVVHELNHAAHAMRSQPLTENERGTPS